MEIERKFLVDKIPFSLDSYKKKEISQGYLCTNPVLRIRKSNDEYRVTYKGEGLVSREEYDLPFSKEGFYRLVSSVDGALIEKTRYLIPFGKYTIELDVFHGDYEGLIMAEVEFEDLEECEGFAPPEWFGEDVSESGLFQNSKLCRYSRAEREKLLREHTL